MGITDLLGRVSEGIHGIKVKSILDIPIKALLILFLLVVIAAIFKVDTWILIVMFSIVGLLFLFILFVFMWFAIKEPDYLRSESFQLRMRTLEVMGNKDALLPTDPTRIIYSSAPILLNGDEEKED